MNTRKDRGKEEEEEKRKERTDEPIYQTRVEIDKAISQRQSRVKTIQKAGATKGSPCKD
jgi:hypothetical protein